MAEEVKTGAKFHNIILENRGRLNVSGVEDVDSFDEGAVIIFTNMGVLTVRGEDLHINKFSVESGELFVEGNIYALTYSDDSMKKSGSGGFFPRCSADGCNSFMEGGCIWEFQSHNSCGHSCTRLHTESRSVCFTICSASCA